MVRNEDVEELDSKVDDNNNSDVLDMDSNDDGYEDMDLELNTNYAKRLMLVNGICGLGLEPIQERQKTAFGSRHQVNMIHLPGAEGFSDMLTDYMKEVKGEKGRKSKAELKLPMDLGKFPSRAKPNPKAIEMADSPWLPTASKVNTSLVSTQVFNFPVVPKVLLDQDKIRTWESSAREELSLASNNTWFLKATRMAIQGVQDKLWELSKKKLEKKDWDDLWESLDKIQGLVDTAGIGTKKIAENAVSDIGSMLLVRRDCWLKKLLENKVITKQDSWDLRHTDINHPALFDQGELDKISDKSQKRESDTISKRLLENVMKEKQERGNQSFRGGPPGQSSRGGSNASKRGGSAPGFGRGRGSSRGRGGRGNFNRNPFRQDNRPSDSHTSQKGK